MISSLMRVPIWPMMRSATGLSMPSTRTAQGVPRWVIRRISSSCASSALPAQIKRASSNGTWRSSATAASSVSPSKGATSTPWRRAAIALLTMPPSRSGVERLEDVGEQPRPALAQPPLARRLRQEAADRASDVDLPHPPRTTEGVRKLSLRKLASVSPIRSLFLGTIAVCGIGRPSGWRKSAVTANQSAMPPTRPASAKART